MCKVGGLGAMFGPLGRRVGRDAPLLLSSAMEFLSVANSFLTP